MAEELPGLQAREAMQTATAVAVGSGSLKKGEAQRVVREWRRLAGRGKRSTAKATPSMLAGMGIKVVRQGAANDN